MGYNSVVLLRNDCWHEIERNPEEFVRQLSPHVGGGLGIHDIAVGSSGNAATFVYNQHADVTGVIVVGGNYATVAGTVFEGPSHLTPEGNLEVLKLLLEQNGYEVRKRAD
jgi:hypothetical protein